MVKSLSHHKAQRMISLPLVAANQTKCFIVPNEFWIRGIGFTGGRLVQVLMVGEKGLSASPTTQKGTSKGAHPAQQHTNGFYNTYSAMGAYFLFIIRLHFVSI